MKRNLIKINHIAFMLLFVTTTLISSCDKAFIPENETTISDFSEDESHYFGQNCMNCHHSAGPGEGWFSLAGSVGGNNNNAIIELFYDTTTPPIHQIEVDKKGNFYTTNKIDYHTPFTVGVRNKNNDIKYMESKITVGQCNLCHGATTSTLNINW